MANATYKPRRHKSREVSSRYLSPTSADHPPPPSPNHTLSPHHQKPRSSTDTCKEKHHRSSPGFIWPSATPPPATTTITTTTLADYLDRKDNNYNNNATLLNRQRSCTEFNRFESPKQSSSKENHKPLFSSGSARYTFKFPGRSSTSSSSKTSIPLEDNHVILPGRLSVDENALRRKPFNRRSDSFSDESECSDLGGSPWRNSPVSYMSPTVSSRKSSNEVPSKYMNPMKRANSLTLPSKWTEATSPGGTPSFTSLKPPTCPSKTKKLLNLGLDLIKGMKSGPSGSYSPLGPGSGLGIMDSVHQLRIMHNRLVQWRFVNARAEIVNENIADQAERNLVYARDGIEKLRHSVLQKKLQLEKQKLEMKLNFIVHSQHLCRLSYWKHGLISKGNIFQLFCDQRCMHSVVCRVPLIEGAKVEPQSASTALRHASDLAASIKSMLSGFSHTAEEAVLSLSELAEVATQEKSLLEECLEHFKEISTLEMQERSLKCSILQIATKTRTAAT